LIALAVLGFSIAQCSRTAAEEAQPSASIVADLVTAVEQADKIPPQLEKLSQKLAKPGAEADQLATEVLGSLDKIECH
jgi:hypothetical protein